MSMSSNTDFSIPVTTLQYRDISAGALARRNRTRAECRREQNSGRRRQDRSRRMRRLPNGSRKNGREALCEIEQQLRTEYERKLLAERAPIATAVTGFEEERTST